MKTTALILLLVSSSAALADGPVVNLTKEQLGNAGPPAAAVTVGNEAALGVGDSMYHAPQYLPYHPTAATIWPRVVEVPCIKAEDGTLTCEGFHWLPEMGRAEYLFVIPKVKEVPPPKVVTVEKKVFIEVPVKKKKE
jgi:hypothetical protein